MAVEIVAVEIVAVEIVAVEIVASCPRGAVLPLDVDDVHWVA